MTLPVTGDGDHSGEGRAILVFRRDFVNFANMKERLLGKSPDELKTIALEAGLPAFAGKQIAQWLYQKRVSDISEMTNLSRQGREVLSEKYEVGMARPLDVQTSADGTRKYLFPVNGDAANAVEAVMIPDEDRKTLCVSSQAGCAMGCTFCASTLHGVTRNLTAGEMLAEIFWINDYLRPKKQKVDTMVLMGSGEPMMNYDNVLGFLRLMHEKYCLNFSYRNVAISTSGVVPGIKRLEKENLPITLSISLHAANDSLRSELMPINKKYSIHDVVAAGKSYSETTRRRVTYEYILIYGVNDTEKDACDLANLLRGQMANVNLIPINPVRERHWKRPSKERVGDFLKYLEKLHISATIRREMGTDIQAACGQLRNQYEDGAEREFFD